MPRGIPTEPHPQCRVSGFTAAIGFALACAWLGLAPRTPAAAPTIPGDVDRALRQRIDYGYNQGIVVGLINRDGRTVRGYGWRNQWMDSPPDGQTIFEIGSITKLFTATLLADAVVRHEVDLDTTVQSLLPAGVQVPRGNDEIRLLHLATHRSGLPSLPDNLCSTKVREPFACYDVTRLYEFLGHYTLTREPDADWEYSNFGFGLLGHALAVRAGRTYEDLLRERVLEPLGLSSTRENPLPAQADHLASGYSGVVAVPPFRMPALEGAGVLRSTVDDLLTFLSHHLGFQESPLADVLRETRLKRAETAYPGVSIGLAWLLVPLAGGQVLEHDGETPGFSSFIGFHPGRGLGVVILSNARVNAFSGTSDVAVRLLDPSSPLTPITRPATVPESILATYPGIYRSTKGDVFELGMTRSRLVLYHVRSDFEFTPYPQSNTRFTGLDIELGSNAIAQFRTNAVGTVTRFDWTQNGQTVAYNRVAEPAKLLGIRDADGLLLSITGGAEASFRIEASSDFRLWEPIGIVRTGSAGIADPGAGSTYRFYRGTRLRE